MNPSDWLNFIPEKYRGLALALIALSPIIGRAIQSLRTGGGLKGMISGIWLGTNVPAQGTGTAGASQANKNQIPLLIFAGLLAVTLTMGIGCASAPKVEYTSSVAAHNTLDAAWEAWRDYETQFNPPQDTRVKMQGMFQKANAALLVVIDAEAAGNSGSLTAATQNLATDMTDITTLLTTLGVKL